MWQITKNGFISVVAYDPAKDAVGSFKDKVSDKTTHVLVRARVKADLEQLATVVSDLQIEDDTYADYRWRTVITRAEFGEFQLAAIDGIDYDSHFKEAFRDNAPDGSTRYKDLMSVWSTLSGWQDGGLYSGYSDWSDYYASGKSKFGSSYTYSSKSDELAGEQSVDEVYEDLFPLGLEHVRRALTMVGTQGITGDMAEKFNDTAFEVFSKAVEVGYERPLTDDEFDSILDECNDEELAKKKTKNVGVDSNFEELLEDVDKVLDGISQ